MSLKAQIEPKQKAFVFDLLQQAGLDVSDWANSKRGPAGARSNPKYCYSWSFEQPGEFVVVCLWYADIVEANGTLVQVRPSRTLITHGTDAQNHNWKRRSKEVEDCISLAYRQQLPVRVIVNEGLMRKATDLDPKASEVKSRLLDPLSWAVTEYKQDTGHWILTRGSKPIFPATEAPDAELSAFEGKWRIAFIKHRHREASLRREKIKQHQNLNGGRLICEVPSCGFDFEENYGNLGKGYAQVHHLKPLGSAPKDGHAVLLSELAVVCANCHAMIHVGGQCRPLDSLFHFQSNSCRSKKRIS